MRRLPLIFSVFAGAVLCLSLTFWARTLLVAPLHNADRLEAQVNVVPGMEQWSNLFGASQTNQDDASHFRLHGVVVTQSAEDRVAIISINGKSAKSVYVNQELMNEARLSEVHETYIIIRVAGVDKRISFPLSLKMENVAQPTFNEERMPYQQAIKYAERNRRVPIAIPEPLVTELSNNRPAVAVAIEGNSELPTASYPTQKTQ